MLAKKRKRTGEKEEPCGILVPVRVFELLKEPRAINRGGPSFQKRSHELRNPFRHSFFSHIVEKPLVRNIVEYPRYIQT